MNWEKTDRDRLEAPALGRAHSFTDKRKKKSQLEILITQTQYYSGGRVDASPLLVREQRVRLQPGRDVSVHREAVVGTGCLELANLREDLKLLGEKGTKDPFTTTEISRRVSEATTLATRWRHLPACASQS